MGASTCPAAPRAHVGHVGPLVGGGVVLLHRAKALPRRSVVAPHGVELPWNRHSHGSHCNQPRGHGSCMRAALGTRLNLLGCLGKSLAKGSGVASQTGGTVCKAVELSVTQGYNTAA